MAKEKTTTEQDFSFLNEDDNAKGFEKIGMGEQAIPFIRIAQAISPQVQKSKPEFIEGLNAGDIFNTVTKENYGTKIKIIAGGFDHVYIEWPSERNKGGPIAYHTPEHAEEIATDKTFGKWMTKDGTKLQETYMYYILIVDKESEGIAVISLKSSEIKVAKQWNRRLLNTMLPNGKKARAHYLIWEMGVTEKTNDQGTWYQLTIDFNGYVTEELYKAVSAERKALPSVSSLDLKQLESPTSNSDESDEKIKTEY